jgi:hypothetical protein
LRRAAASLAGALLLAGCPIPQPLPDYPPGTITPPRILTESLTIQESIIFVPAECTSTVPGPAYTLGARLFDSNNIEQVQARWFVNYPDRVDPVVEASVPPDGDPTVFGREVEPYVFHPYEFAPPQGGGARPFNTPGTIRVVELLVSNAFFDPPGNAPVAWRSPAPNFETQLQRWTFLLVDGSNGGGPTNAACPK